MLNINRRHNINYLICGFNEMQWMDKNRIICEKKEKLSMDGKTSNGSSRSTGINKDGEVVNIMSVYSNNYCISLIQDYITEKK